MSERKSDERPSRICIVVPVKVCCSDFELFSQPSQLRVFSMLQSLAASTIILLTSVLFDFNSFFESAEQLCYRESLNPNRETEGHMYDMYSILFLLLSFQTWHIYNLEVIR